MKKISIGDVFYECGGAFDSTKKIICNNKNIELIKNMLENGILLIMKQQTRKPKIVILIMTNTIYYKKIKLKNKKYFLALFFFCTHTRKYGILINVRGR